MGDWILFDDGCPTLSPLFDLRACFELRTGASTTAARLTRQLGEAPAGIIVPDRLAALAASRHSMPVNAIPDDVILFVNGRWTSITCELPVTPNTAIVTDDGTVLAALLDPAAAEGFVASGFRPPDSADCRTVTDQQIIRHPWEIILHGRANLVEDIAAMEHLQPLKPTAHIAVIGDGDVLIGEGAKVDPMTVIDTSAGVVAIDAGAHIGAHCVLDGPCYIGRRSTVNARAHIRSNTIIGPMCKVGGETGGCVYQAYSNKGHYGYLGDSYVGEWVNLGAGTTTSNLKNTYGPVKMQTAIDGAPADTGMRYLGSIIGDHVKTAIGTRLLTGSCIGTGAMIALGGFAPKYVSAFAFLTDAGETRYELERFCAVADRVMQRRGRRVDAELTQALAELYAATGE